MIRRPHNYLGRVLGNGRGLQRGGLSTLGYQEGGEVDPTTLTQGDVADYTDLGTGRPHFIYTGQGIMSNVRDTPYNPNNPFAGQYPDLVDLNLDGVIDQSDVDIYTNTSTLPPGIGQPPGASG